MKKFTSLAALILISGCGGGGSDDTPTSVSANPPVAAAPATTPAPSTPKPVVPNTPAPVTPPVSAPPPPGQPPAAAPDPCAAQGCATGAFLLKALQAGAGNVTTDAYEVVGGKADVTALRINQAVNLNQTFYNHYAAPYNYNPRTANAKFPQAAITIEVDYTAATGFFALSKQATIYTQDNGPKNTVLVRGESFVIRPDDKVVLNSFAAEWKGLQGTPWFLQLGVSTTPISNTLLRVCWHQYGEGVRRLACTLHNKDTGDFRGTQSIDDSQNLGATEFLPLSTN